MMARITIRWAILAALLVLAGTLTQVEARDGDRNRVEGTITAVSSSGVTITTARGTAVQVSVNSATKIERNGRHVPLSALQVGDRGQARLDGAAGVATKLESTGP